MTARFAAVILAAAVSLFAGCTGASVQNETADTSALPTEAEIQEANEVERPERPALSKDMKLIALTFDDGPNMTTTNSVIDKLEKYNIVASFFVIGDNIVGDGSEGSSKVMKRAYDMGCEINSHSRSHPDMTKLTPEEIHEEMDYTSERIESIVGEKPSFFRPPYIAVDGKMFDEIDLPFIAGIGADDWMDSVSAEERAERILKNAKDGCIILLHDSQGNSKTVEALDTIIPSLLDEGYTFVTVSELFGAKEVEPQDGIVYSFTDQTSMY